MATLADAGDKFTRNEILTSNEFRSGMGVKPSKEKQADELRNKNITPGSDSPKPQPEEKIVTKDEGSTNG